MPFSLNDRVKISDQVLTQEVSGEMVILDLNSEFYFGLDSTGTRIWQLLQSGSRIGGAIEQLLEEFEVDRERLEKDTDTLLAALLDAGLVSLERSS